LLVLERLRGDHRRAQRGDRGGPRPFHALLELGVVVLDQAHREVGLHGDRDLGGDVLAALTHREQHVPFEGVGLGGLPLGAQLLRPPHCPVIEQAQQVGGLLQGGEVVHRARRSTESSALSFCSISWPRLSAPSTWSSWSWLASKLRK